MRFSALKILKEGLTGNKGWTPHWRNPEPKAEYDAIIAYLRERELVSSAYLEKVLPLRFADGREELAVTYVIDPDHVQYCGSLDLEEQAQIIARAVGGRGPNSEYLFNTASHLAELGIPDAELDWLCARVRVLIA